MASEYSDVPSTSTNITMANTSLKPQPPLNADLFDSVRYWENLSLIDDSWSDDPAFWPTVITYGITFTVGFIGNALVIFALLIDPKGRNITSTFLVSLAAADLMFLLICVPYEVAAKLTAIWQGGEALCKMAGFVEMLTAFASVLNLTAVSVERYFVIVHPMKSRSWCTVGKTKKFICAVWVVAILFASPTIHIYETETALYYNKTDYVITLHCADSNFISGLSEVIFAWYHLVVLFLIPVAIMAFCYSLVIRVLWLSTKELAKMTCTESSDDESKQRLTSPKHKLRHGKAVIITAVKDHSAEIREARKQVIRMLLTIIAIFFLCWGPRLVLNLLKRHSLSILHDPRAFYVNLIVGLLPYMQSCSNPIIYSFMSKNFRRSMRTGCKIVCHCDPCSKFEKRRRPIEFDMDTKTANGMSFGPSSRYESPSMMSRTGGKTYVSVVSDN